MKSKRQPAIVIKRQGFQTRDNNGNVLVKVNNNAEEEEENYYAKCDIIIKERK